jgi:hypothetical protein
LLSAGFSVIAAYNGVHAIKLMERRRLPDVIVLGLGPHPGLDLYDELRTHADRNRIPVVVVARASTSRRSSKPGSRSCSMRLLSRRRWCLPSTTPSGGRSATVGDMRPRRGSSVFRWQGRERCCQLRNIVISCR